MKNTGILFSTSDYYLKCVCVLCNKLLLRKLSQSQLQNPKKGSFFCFDKTPVVTQTQHSFLFIVLSANLKPGKGTNGQ